MEDKFTFYEARCRLLSTPIQTFLNAIRRDGGGRGGEGCVCKREEFVHDTFTPTLRRLAQLV